MSAEIQVGDEVEVTVRGRVVAIAANNAADHVAGKVAVFITVPGAPPDLHFGAPGQWFWVAPEEARRLVTARGVSVPAHPGESGKERDD